jgi:O-acetylhomoserine/O-acetylserine sulfhydrylase-like pyridoxal-dependent enzyme
MKFETLVIHAGQEPDPANGAVMTHLSTAESQIIAVDSGLGLSVGVEQVEDLLEDIDQALDRV